MKDFVELFNDSYQRAVDTDPDRFFGRFYTIFFSKSPAIAAKFNNTDMKQQQRMLRQSMVYMLNFYVSKKSSEHLQRIALLHSRKQKDIEPRLYDLWMDSIVETVAECDLAFSREVDLAWRIVMAPGITYMRFYYDS